MIGTHKFIKYALFIVLLSFLFLIISLNSPGQWHYPGFYDYWAMTYSPFMNFMQPDWRGYYPFPTPFPPTNLFSVGPIGRPFPLNPPIPIDGSYDIPLAQFNLPNHLPNNTYVNFSLAMMPSYPFYFSFTPIFPDYYFYPLLNLGSYLPANQSDSESEDIPEKLTISNEVISVTLNSTDMVLSVRDKRTGHSWRQASFNEAALVNAKIEEGIEMTWLDTSSDREVKTVIKIIGDLPEFTLSLFIEGKMSKTLRFPYPFVSETEDYLVIPVDEGISYPVEDETIGLMNLVSFSGGYGICMPFWGVTNGEQGHMAIIETPDDASIQMERVSQKLCIRPEWLPQKGYFGYKRHLRYVFFDKGGHVAIAKRYRQYAQEEGLLKSLSQKRAENPNVDLLIGAVNVWCWEGNPPAIVSEMKSLGIERILWSRGGTPEEIDVMNKMGGILTSRYDIYKDLMDPEVIEQQLVNLDSNWTQAGWPDDLLLDENQVWRKGWFVAGKDGKFYPCGILCDRQALNYAHKRVPEELEEYPYKCRFIDTTTASPWMECYHPDHPMTRSESRQWRMELLRFISEDMGLVTGSETGHDAAVPYVHYFEGMLSLWPYRLPSAGRNMHIIVEEVPEKLQKFQVGHKYRLPLWELVYHDCVVAHWYWGDYNNKLPALWKKRDLFNILYGTPPMFMFYNEIWEENKARFVQSYQDICPVARAVGYSEMIDHRFLTPDRSVQQTVFANGIKIIVNFGDMPYSLDNGKELVSMGFQIINDE